MDFKLPFYSYFFEGKASNLRGVSIHYNSCSADKRNLKLSLLYSDLLFLKTDSTGN